MTPPRGGAGAAARTFDPLPPPLAGRRWLRQTWADITFIHWTVDPELVAPLMPPGTRPDVLDGATYVGLVPFRLENGGFGIGPAVPWWGTFLETNVRLYSVDDAGRHGVVFVSLECERLAVAVGARMLTGTPYTWARMRRRRTGPSVTDETARRWPRPRGARSTIQVRIGEPVENPTVQEQFVTARFGLHTRVLGRTLWIPNHHRPWPLRRATLDRLDDTLLAVGGLGALAVTEPTSVLHSTGTDTEFGTPQRL